MKSFFFFPKRSEKSRSVLQEGSRSLGLLWKGKIRIIAKFQRTVLVICSHSREGKTPAYSQINMVSVPICKLFTVVCVSTVAHLHVTVQSVVCINSLLAKLVE